MAYGQFRKYRNLLNQRARTVDHWLICKNISLQGKVSNGGETSFCSGGRTGRNESVTARRESRVSSTKCRLKQTCCQKSSRGKA